MIIKNGHNICESAEEYQKRFDDCLKTVCVRELKCNPDDISLDMRNAFYEMYKWGEARRGYFYPMGIEYEDSLSNI